MSRCLCFKTASQQTPAGGSLTLCQNMFGIWLGIKVPIEPQHVCRWCIYLHHFTSICTCCNVRQGFNLGGLGGLQKKYNENDVSPLIAAPQSLRRGMLGASPPSSALANLDPATLERNEVTHDAMGSTIMPNSLLRKLYQIDAPR